MARLLALTLLILPPSGLAAGPIEKLVVAGEVIESGIYDASLEYVPDGSVGWMLYSSVEGPLFPFGPIVETHLAQSLDHGATWTFAGEVNASFPGSVSIGGTAVAGRWNYEVASLVHDPGDPGREWKLFVHRIFRVDDPESGLPSENHPEYGWIAFRHAPDPNGPWSSDEALFRSDLIPFAPYTARINLNALDPNLGDLLTYSEPGAFEQAGTLYLSLTGLLATGPERLVLVASDDHAASWRFVSVLADNEDAAALGFLSFDGSAIAAEAGRVFLLASPQSSAFLHDGTLVLEFDDLAAGRLRRGADGRLIATKHLLPQAGFGSAIGGGQADFHVHNTAGGIVMPQLNQNAFPELFQLFNRHESLLSAPASVGGLGWLGLGGIALALAGSVLQWGRPSGHEE